VLIGDELGEFRVENGVQRGPLKRNRIKTATFVTC